MEWGNLMFILGEKNNKKRFFNMMQRSLEQNKMLHVLFGQLGLEAEVKEDICKQYSNGRTSSTKELFYDEANAMIEQLKAMSYGRASQRFDSAQRPSLPPIGKAKNAVDERTKAERMRKKILHYCHLMRWEVKPGGRVDYERLNRWLVTYGKPKKSLNNLSNRELPEVLSQFEQVYKKFTIEQRG